MSPSVATTARLEPGVAAGRLQVVHAELGALDVDADAFDVAFALNVNIFWTRDPVDELDVLRRALRPSGVLHVLYGVGPAGTSAARRVVAVVSDALSSNGFVDVTGGSDVRGTRICARPGD